MIEKPLVGISTCLLGENVRYDGGHKLDRYLRDTLGKFVDYIPICPEVECGLSVPREAMRLVDVDGNIRLMTQKTEIDLTDTMLTWMNERLSQLATRPLCGFLFKSRSPSSGWKGVKVYRQNNVIRQTGIGIFANGFTTAFPHIPVEDDGRFHDDTLRENFIERIFVMQRWYAVNQRPKTLKNLMDFHASHKFLLMAHSPQTLKELGSLLAHGKDFSLDELYNLYLDSMLPALQRIATVKKNTNVLLHIMGYFKNDLESEEKAELREIIDQYHNELVPLIVPVTIINHYVRKYKPEYLLNQVYLNPHPLELMLRNHV